MRRISLTIAWAALAMLMAACVVPAAEEKTAANAATDISKDVTQGALRIVAKDGGVVECPLRHTDVKASISGFIARVKVTQTFYNPLDEKIEAVYVFPLPHEAAVDDMTMVLGDRRIVGIIKRRDAARQIYEAALAAGQTAALLEQERPNIFTQSVGNIAPQQEVRIEISYVDVLKYDVGTYEFHFPMVVGPRYIPGSPTSSTPPVPPELQGKVGELPPGTPQGTEKPAGTGWSPDTTRVPDASRITPPVLKPGFRNGHDIALAVKLDAGVPVQDLKVTNHKAEIERDGPTKAAIVMSTEDSIPNKDFVLRYAVVGKKPEMAVLSYAPAGQERGYFMLMVQPKEDERLTQSPPRELVFLVDVSGSMSGQPMAKVREAMALFLKRTKPEDTVQVVAFAGMAQKLFDKPVEANEENIKKALNFSENMRGGGGTEMLKGIKMALDEPADAKRVRVILLMTDGYIGNEAEIIAEVGRRAGDRVRFWCVGIGSSPNRFLVDGVAKQGGGMSKVLGLNDDPTELVTEAMNRIHRAQLSHIQIDWGTLKVANTYPTRIPELWAGRPVIVYGRYAGGGKTEIKINGSVEGTPASWPVEVALPQQTDENAVLSKVWARQRIENLMQLAYYGDDPEVVEAVTEIALQYRLMSQYTSFVAVDEKTAKETGEPARPPRRMLVPVPLPEGTRYEGFFGGEHGRMFAAIRDDISADFALRAPGAASAAPAGPAPTGGAYFPAMTAAKPQSGRMPGRSDRRDGGYAYGGGRMKAGEAKLKRTADISRARMGWYIPPAGHALMQEAAKQMAAGDAWADAPAIPTTRPSPYAVSQSIQSMGADLPKQAADALQKAEAAEKAGKLAEAGRLATWAYLLDTAAGNRSDGQTADKALELIDRVRAAEVGQWTKATPALGKRLDLVLRDLPLAEALAKLAAAAGVKITLADGAAADAAAMTGSKELRVSWLDLRGATLVEALDWLLRPERLQWQVADGAVLVSTGRRMDGPSAWVYDASLLALPDAKPADDWQKQSAALTEALAQFRKAVIAMTGVDEGAVAWFGPGQLLIWATPARHAATADLIGKLADPKAEFDKKMVEAASTAGVDAAALHKATAERAAARAENAAKLAAYAGRVQLAAALDEFTWRLLAEAADGRCDLEALTELQIAWRTLGAEKLAARGGLLPLRSAWAIGQAAAALPGETELKALAVEARTLAAEGIAAAFEQLEKQPGDPSADAAALYAAMLSGKSQDREKLRSTLAGQGGGPAGQVVGPIAAALFADQPSVSAADLVKVMGQQSLQRAATTDVVVLLAAASRRAGGEAWQTFRADGRDLLGNLPLPGAVVVLVTNLATAELPILGGTH